MFTPGGGSCLRARLPFETNAQDGWNFKVSRISKLTVTSKSQLLIFFYYFLQIFARYEVINTPGFSGCDFNVAVLIAHLTLPKENAKQT